MEDTLTPKNIVRRLKGPMPKFWKKIRNTMLLLGAVGGALIAAPIALPAAIVTAAGYLVTAGAVGAALSQMTKEDNPKEEKPKEDAQ